MFATIITIGDEILIGQIVDTNSAWISAELNSIGISIDAIWSISDTKEAIQGALDKVPDHVGLVVLTGGLGPTKDDITKKTLAEWFGGGWVVNEEVLQRVERHFKERGHQIPAASSEQAQVPEAATILTNRLGTAPGMWFEKNEKIFVSMPGVPYEMKGIFQEELIPRLRKKAGSRLVVHRTIMTQGVGESTLMEILQEWESQLEMTNLKLAYLPSPGAVRLRISGVEELQGEVGIHDQITLYVEKLLPLIGQYIFGFDDEKLEQVVGRMLREKGQSLGLAESCTGGYIAHLFTSHAGSSDFFNGSVTSYSNDAKISILGVDSEVLKQKGAVSAEVAEQMALGAKRVLNADFAISTTGVAGPGGGSAEKPVGTVWIGVASPSGVSSHKFVMGNLRESNIRKSALQAIQLLRKSIMQEMKLSEKDSLILK